MRRKKIIIVSSIVVVLLCAFLAISSMQNMDIKATKKSDVLKQTSSKDDSWNKVSKEELVIENDNYLFRLNGESTHFNVTHKDSGKVYYSIPQTTEAFEPNAEQKSEVILTYYDSNSAKNTMNSYENSVEGKSFEIKSDGTAIRVYYSIQKSKQRVFVPPVIGQEVFEETILPALQSGPARRLKSFYDLYESENSDEETDEMKSTYPVLHDENLYILNGSAGEHTYSEITSYFDAAKYGTEEYATETERLGLDSSLNDNMPAGFVVPVEYSLNDNGFTATVLTDKITSESTNYKLTDISLLPYFASCGYSEDGWYLVPDGSGAIIEFDEKAGSTYSQRIWGTDYAIERLVKPNLQQNAGMPIFGFHSGDSAILGVISGGAAVATVDAEVYGNEFVLNRIYTDFNVLAYDSSDADIAQQSNKAAFNLYASDYVAEFPQVTYLLCAEKETTYSDMAKIYRQYLIDKGILGERIVKKDNVSIYFDFTGYETTEQSVMGIATKAKTPLSTVEDISETIKELEKRDITGINVRLKAYANDGIYGTVSNGFKIDKCIGTENELATLAEKLSGQEGKLYLDNNISTVYSSGNSYKKMTHAARSAKRTIVYGMDFDLVSQKQSINKYYMTSPSYYKSLTENFVKTLSKQYDNPNIYGYSWSDFGTKLWSDFNKQMSYDRAQAADAAVEAVKLANNTFDKVITDGSNSYVLSHVDTMLNIPLNSSGLSCESYSVPFYQMVIHGYIDYAGAPINTSADTQTTYLASIESGASLYYNYYTAEGDPLKETEAGTLVYPTWIGDSYDFVEKQYKEFKEVFQPLCNLLITDHMRIAEDVYVTTYENNTKILVNYSSKDYMWNEQSIPSQGYIVLEGRSE